jgi:hypothetical protein
MARKMTGPRTGHKPVPRAHLPGMARLASEAPLAQLSQIVLLVVQLDVRVRA